MSKIDFSRLSKGIATVQLDMWELTPEEDGVEYPHYRISIIRPNDKPRFLGACGEGIWEWTDLDELYEDYDRLIEWQRQNSTSQ